MKQGAGPTIPTESFHSNNRWMLQGILDLPSNDTSPIPTNSAMVSSTNQRTQQTNIVDINILFWVHKLFSCVFIACMNNIVRHLRCSLLFVARSSSWKQATQPSPCEAATVQRLGANKTYEWLVNASKVETKPTKHCQFYAPIICIAASLFYLACLVSCCLAWPRLDCIARHPHQQPGCSASGLLCQPINIGHPLS